MSTTIGLEQQLNVILDTSLKPVKPIFNNNPVSASPSCREEISDENTVPVKNQLYLDRNNPSNYYSQYEHTEHLLGEAKNGSQVNHRYQQTDHHLVNGFLYAYNNHLPLKIRPDDIQLIIQAVLSICVNNNAEKFRPLFVDHAGKMKISVKSETFDPDFFCTVFTGAMKSNLKDPIFVDKFSAKYSTTTPLIRTVSNMMLMNTLKEYFSFEMILGCGIPNIILCGSQGDWKVLSENYIYLKNFFKGTELDNWFKHFDTIIEMFLEMRMLGVSGSVRAPDHIKELWKRVISYVPQGSGGDKILGGWIRLLIPYTTDNKLIGGLDKKVPCLDISMSDPSLGEKGITYAMQDKLRDFYIASGWSTVPKSNVITPATLIDYDGTEYQVEFASGFFESAFVDGCVSMNIGFIMTENMTIKTEAKQAYYLEKGVQKEKCGMLLIPRFLRFETDEIQKAFDAHGWSLYGKDPNEEAEKQKYLDLGVIIELKNRNSIFRIPEVLKEQEKYIRTLFEVYGWIKSEYY